MNEKNVPTLKFVLEDEKGSKWTSGVTWQETKQKQEWLEGRISHILERIDEVSRAVFKIQEVLADSLTKKCKDEMLKYLMDVKAEKSFKEWDFRVQFEAAGYGWGISRTAFAQLVTEGKIGRRGKSCWYRLHHEVQSP